MKCIFLSLVLIFSLCSCDYQAVNQPEIVSDEVETVTEASSTMEVHFIDVGQADAALIISNGESMLIDGGNRDDSDLIYTYLKNNNVDHLNYVVGTHAHEDHIGGIPGALKYASIDTVLSPVTNYDSKTWDNFERYVGNRNSTISIPSIGDKFAVGEAVVTIIACNYGEETNNTSIVLKIEHGSNSFLFTGDAEEEVEKRILEDKTDIDVDVLKVGHHGSDSSSCYQFLKAVTPKYSIISCGTGNSYGHPHEGTMSRLRDVDSKVFRTDLQGTIICYSDGQKLEFVTERNSDTDTIQLPPNSAQKKQDSDITYILNTNSMKFHTETCSIADSISNANKQVFIGSRESLINDGYQPCGKCKP